MRDRGAWREWVRARLGDVATPRWDETLRDRVVEDLAEMLAECEREALDAGGSSEQATQRAESQIPDWLALVREIDRAETTGPLGTGFRTTRGNASTRPRDDGGRPASSLVGLGQDLRSAVRTLMAAPGLSALIVLTLALGVGANAAIFGLVDAVLLEPLPFPQPEELVRIFSEHPEQGISRADVSTGDVVDWRRRSEGLEGIGAWYVMGRTLAAIGAAKPAAAKPAERELAHTPARTESAAADDSGAAAEVVHVAQVSEDFFSVLGVAPLLGRTFSREETAAATFNSAASHTGTDPVVVLSHRAFRERFGADPQVLDRTLQLDRQTWRVVGVMPPGFDFPDPGVELWIPWGLDDRHPHDQRYLAAVARLRPDVTREQGEASLDGVAAALAQELPDSNEGWQVALVPLFEEMVGAARTTLLVLLAAVAVVLLVACLNIACLQLSRIGERQRELALRLALGASRLRLARQLLVEKLLLAGVGFFAALVVARAALGTLGRLDLGGIPRLHAVELDARVWGVAALVCLLAGLFFGLLPLAVAPRRNLAATIGETSGRAAGVAPRWERIRRSLVACELALAVVLLAAAGLLLRSFEHLTRVDVGFDPEHVAVLPITLDNREYETGAESRAYYRSLLEKLSGLPGVVSAGGVTALPMSPIGPDFDRPVWAEGELPPPGGSRRADTRVATPGYFQTLRIPVLRGRAFDERDTPESNRVVMVNETLAQQLWPGEDPIGKRLVIDYSTIGTYSYEVVGVTGDVRFYGLRSQPRAEMFLPHAQAPYLILNIAVRTEVDPEILIPELQRAVLEIDPLQPAYRLRPLQDLVAGSIARDRFALSTIGGFGAVTLALALLGILGVLSYQVARRTHEVGVRAALGASREQLVRMMLRSGLAIAALGLGLGVLLALALTRALRSLLFEVSPTDPATFVVVVVVCAVGALLACWVPARRAASVDPAIALRHE